MQEVLRRLAAQSLVLDLGCGSGSFKAPPSRRVVRADSERPAAVPENFVLCSAAALPFRDSAFALVVSNHSLEHFEQLERALAEMGRVTRRDGAIYIAVPDASTFTDRLYRWLARGGGHVNAFTSPRDVIDAVEPATGLPHRATRVLYTSLSFLNRHNRRSRAPRKLWLLAGGAEPVLRWLTYLLRRLDRRLGTRTALYGWVLWFGNVGNVNTRAWTNVCIRCGSGAPSDWLRASACVKRGWIRDYRCPRCGARNLFTDDV
ncbi:MAG: class I SAM-dependent methyltransferase [Acidobacteria bacterium]|nr:class I SAM-dependent methyltransferase [Acidobacteriota bacterium]MBI3279995.1 class I SAM-dependent methyltransferase [Acidobacteriota bacterium]